MGEKRNYWDKQSYFLPHILTDIEREEWLERSAIIEADEGIPRWEADLKAGRICIERWANLRVTGDTGNQIPLW